MGVSVEPMLGIAAQFHRFKYILSVMVCYGLLLFVVVVSFLGTMTITLRPSGYEFRNPQSERMEKGRGPRLQSHKRSCIGWDPDEWRGPPERSGGREDLEERVPINGMWYCNEGNPFVMDVSDGISRRRRLTQKEGPPGAKRREGGSLGSSFPIRFII